MKLLILATCALAAQPAQEHESAAATEVVAFQNAQTRHLIRAGASQRHVLASRSGQIERLRVDPARARDMEIYLFDANGKLLAADLDASDGLSIGFRPGWSGPFTLVVRNISRQVNMYAVQVE